MNSRGHAGPERRAQPRQFARAATGAEASATVRHSDRSAARRGRHGCSSYTEFDAAAPREPAGARAPRRSSPWSPSSCGRRARSWTRPPGMDAWIDTYHAVRGLVRGRDVRVPHRQRRRRARRAQPPSPRHQPRRRRPARSRRAVPHDEALARLLPRRTPSAPGRKASARWSCSAATRRSGPPRCVEHAWQLREAIREHVPELSLGGWANPHARCRRRRSATSPTSTSPASSS